MSGQIFLKECTKLRKLKQDPPCYYVTAFSVGQSHTRLRDFPGGAQVAAHLVMRQGE